MLSPVNRRTALVLSAGKCSPARPGATGKFLARSAIIIIISMTNQATQRANETERMEDGQMHPAIRSYVTTDAEFRAHVQRGIASAKIGPNRDFASIDVEIRRFLLSP